MNVWFPFSCMWWTLTLFANAVRQWQAVPSCEVHFCQLGCVLKSLELSEECFAAVCRKVLCAKMDLKQMPVSHVIPLVLGSKPLRLLWCSEVVWELLELFGNQIYFYLCYLTLGSQGASACWDTLIFVIGYFLNMRQKETLCTDM